MKLQRSPLTIISTGEDKKRRVRRFMYISVIIVIILLCIWAYLSLTQPDRFPIKTVTIDGDYSHLDQQLFQQKIAPLTTSGFFAINVDAIKLQILTFPWIYKAEVRKIFPDTIKITLIQQQPIAQWNTNALLNADGQLFQPMVSTFPHDLPLLTGPDDQSSVVLATYERMNQMLQPLKLSIVAINLSSRHAWRIELNNHTKVILGRFFIWQRFQTFLALYPKVFASAQQHAASIDMRYPNGFAVHWQKLK
jgi:cell division protein FtsQ